jgi:hypothetical protein
LKKRSLLRLLSSTHLLQSALILLTVTSFLAGCGKNFYFAGRTLPPSAVTNRVLIAVQNPSPFTKGALPFVDAFYDIRHAYNNINVTFSISGASVSVPLTIQNMPEEQAGAIYNSGDGSLSLINYSTEKQSSSIAGSPAASIFISRNQEYVVSADQTAHYLVITDRVIGRTIPLNLPGVYKVSLNPSGTIALAFVQNSNTAYTLVHLTAPQQTTYQAYFAANGTWPANAYGLPAQDCEPENLPAYCVYPISNGNAASFDRPVKALFSPDGSSIYVLNCGPECGGNASSLTTIPVITSSANNGAFGPAAINLQSNATYPIPGGASNAIGSGTTLYVAGQSVQPDGFLAGNLTVFSFTNNQILGRYSIADGAHRKMLFADDNTLFIGSVQCQSGERYHLDPASSAGCLTMFNTSTNAVGLDTYQGDLTGIADIEGLHKIYVAEGGQIYIYRTTDFTQLDNSDVTIVGTAADVAYMDGSTDDNNTTY